MALVNAGHLVHLRPFGHLDYSPESERVREDTIYDLSSLTKVVATTTVLMTLVEDGLDLKAPVARWVPELRTPDKQGIRILDVLSHSSGLPAWAPLFRTTAGWGGFLAAIGEMPLEYEPGSRSLYSDLGFMVLKPVLEAVSGEDFGSLVRTRVVEPLRMESTGFCPAQSLRPRIAPTEVDPSRGGVLRGEVHDENAGALGGVAPHAGLFGTAPDLVRFSRSMLGAPLERSVAAPSTIAEFTTKVGIPGSSRALGWDTPSPGSSAGTLLGPRSFGHTGFTGTSIWFEPDREFSLVLLTNRVHPTRDNIQHREVRSRLADLAVSAVSERA